MCILCVIQKWSRRIATMLPWLVVPLIGLWALSQLLPPAFLFEITSPRLACVFVLLVTLFWYEILMPKLSAWRVRRNARLRERMRVEAIEIQKLRKTAIRRCRNCLTPYRDQNPRGGKFTCSYCGHISKRPVLDLPESLDLGSAGILKYLVGKGGSTFNGKVWSDNGWICGKDWLENGNWVGGPFAGKSSYLKKNGGGYVGGENHCLAEKSYSNILIFTFKAFTAFYLSIAWLWRKIFRVNSSRDDTSTDVELTWLLDQQGENGGNFHESRGEKARRKAEEKRQARLEKELLEEEERKQREEVTRLVEERRRLRDEKLDKKECGKESPSDMDRNRKKDAEKKHQEIKKERDRGSSKSNSDAGESERRFSKESVRNPKIVGNKCEQHRTVSENVKSHSVEVGHGFKSATMSIHNRGTAGTRYLDRMKGTFLSSSRAFSGSDFFGRSANISIVSSEHRPNASVDNVQGSAYRRNVLPPESVSGRSNVNGDDKNVYRPVVTETQPCPAPKRSWQQLFTRSSAVSAPSNPNIIGRPNVKSQTEVQNPPQLFDGPINFGQLQTSTLPPPIGLTNSSRCLPLLSGAIFPRVGEVPDQLLPEESEIFEDSFYVQDPVSLLGPVSEPIDNFQLDLSFVADRILEAPCSVKATPPPSEVTKPSPIQSPLSRSRVSEERHGSSFLSSSIPKVQDKFNDANDSGTWQMWNSSPLGQAGLGLVGGLASWLPELSRPKEDIMHSAPQKKMASLFKNDEKIHAGTHSSQNVFLGNFQNARTFDSSVPCIVDGPWFPETLYGPTSSSENQILLNPREKSDQNGMIYGSTCDCAANQQFYSSTANSWAKKDWTGEGLRDSAGNSSTLTHHISGLYSTSDVQRLWPYP
ncbi:unnamed protein product [Fraxinus pennsylvanica]|uniref:Stress response NST1-like protein n=1 Tax=Fraxinus pennsylvanica TaxID=56036 RepID=A0AAD2DYV7_9LAMI|nr:unnamed protein product [Fraxinus pennsylvanica]